MMGFLAKKFLPDLRFVRNHHKPPNRNDLPPIDGLSTVTKATRPNRNQIAQRFGN